MRRFGFDLGHTQLKVAELVGVAPMAALTPGSCRYQSMVIGGLLVTPRAADPGESARELATQAGLRAGDLAMIAAVDLRAAAQIQLALHAHGVRSIVAGTELPVALVTVYEDENQLGIDRRLSMRAANALMGGECVVVSAGTAITIDAIDAKGVHFDGMIAPGLGLSYAALGQKTPLPAAEAFALQTATPSTLPPATPARGTLACLRRAITEVGVGGVAAAIARLAARPLGECRVVVSGGDGPLIAAGLAALAPEVRLLCIENAVLAGLALLGS